MPTQISIYKNDITREIGGVIYSNDDRNLMQELEEYVITKELQKPRLLPELFDAIAKQKVNSSVWISGYYGSGKSHLLKMIALVLNNKEINNKKSADIFSAKIEDDFDLSNISKKTVEKPLDKHIINTTIKPKNVFFGREFLLLFV